MGVSSVPRFFVSFQRFLWGSKLEKKKKTKDFDVPECEQLMTKIVR